MALAFIKRRPPSDELEQIDLDVTPIMSMFMILLPFLVSMAVLTQLSILEFSLPPNVTGASGGAGEKPRLKLTVVVAPGYFALTHGEALLDSIPALASGYDWRSLAERLLARRQSMQLDSEVVVASRDQVKIKDVVGVMDRCRDTGFRKVGLSSATGTTGSVR